MSNFEDRLTWILSDFKANRIDYAEAILKIEEAIVGCLHLSSYIHKLMSDFIESEHKRKREKASVLADEFFEYLNFETPLESLYKRGWDIIGAHYKGWSYEEWTKNSAKKLEEILMKELYR